MFNALRYYWTTAKGYRLRPWASPYLRWRLETYTGKPADKIEALDFFQLMAREKIQFLRFLRWTGEIRGYSGENRSS